MNNKVTKAPNSNMSKSARKRMRRRLQNNNNLSSGLSVSRPVSAPVAAARVRRSAKPRFSSVNNGSGDIRITHREYINELAGSVSFAANSFPINPGLPSTFPWLSGIAQRYESYLFERLKFCFETESATSATGTVIQVIDYDPSDSAPTSKTQAMAYRSSVRSPPWSDSAMESMREDISKRSSYFVRSGSLSSNEDIKLYDVGNYYACTQGQAGTTTVGELYVEYSVILMTPQLGEAGASFVSGSFTGSSNSAPFATKTGAVPCTVSSSGTTTSVSTFTFTQPWQGIVTCGVTGTGVVSISPSGTGGETNLGGIVNAGGTIGIQYASLVADIGNTYIITISNTTITDADIYFAQFDV